ncbi:MAG: hypothetical protein JNM61_05105 [Zoogloeaceae bacterium]|nr:hypothetical protein [Zoogloeaceae bacterium]
MVDISWVDSPLERTTALTDALLALLALGLSWRGRRALRRPGVRGGLWSAALFSMGVGAGLGAVAHGLKWPAGDLAAWWHGIHLALGLTASFFVGAAIALQILGGAVQAAAWSLAAFRPVDHNGLFHLVQMVGAGVLVVGLGRSARGRSRPGRP